MKKALLVILGIISFYLLFEIKNTYSLFETNSAVEASSELAKWHVKINNNYITNLTTQVNTFELGNIKWDSKEHVVAGKAAPGSIGRFNIEIDPTDTQVSFIYEITIDISTLNNSEFQIKYINETNNYKLVRTGKNTYSAIVTLEEIQSGIKHDIEIGLIWNDNEENNQYDYELGTKANVGINIPVSITVSQYTNNQELVEYVEDSEINETMG